MFFFLRLNLHRFGIGLTKIAAPELNKNCTGSPTPTGLDIQGSLQPDAKWCFCSTFNVFLIVDNSDHRRLRKPNLEGRKGKDIEN